MKLRKIKLLATVCSLLLVLGVMSVGVWASASQVVNVKTTVTFKATGVSGTILATLTGVGGETQYYNSTMAEGGSAIAFSPTGTSLSDWELGGETALNINANDGVPENIVYTFTITNASTTDDIVIDLSNISAGDNLELVSVVQDSTTITQTGEPLSYVFENIAEGGQSVIAVTFHIVNESVSIEAQDLSFTLSLISENAV